MQPGVTEEQRDRLEADVLRELRQHFRPEFLNRVDDIIVFHPLTKDQIAQIVHYMLKDVHARLAEEELRLSLTDEAVKFLVDRGYDEKFGARPLRRAIQRHLEDPLSEKILVSEFSAGDEIRVDVTPEGDALDFRVPSSTKT